MRETLGASKNSQLKGRRTKERLMKSSFTSILLFTAALKKYFSSTLHHYVLLMVPSSCLFSPFWPQIATLKAAIKMWHYVCTSFKHFETFSPCTQCYLRLVLSTQHMHLTVLLVVTLYFCAYCLYYVVITLLSFFFFCIHFSFGS